MSRTTTIQETGAYYPSGLSDDHAYYSASNTTRAYNSHNNTTYAQFILTRGRNAVTYLYYTFDVSEIPSDATIVSVSCSAKSYITTSNSSYVKNYNIGLYSGTSLKGEEIAMPTSAGVRTMSGASWTRSELDDIRIRFYAERATSNTSSSYYIRVYGATLTIVYEIDRTYYTVTTSTNRSSISISPTSQEYLSGENVTISITGDITDGVATDNGTDVTSLITGSGTSYEYSIQSIAADHVFVLNMPETGQKIFYKLSGAWTSVDSIFVKQNGSWKSVETFNLKQNGSWIN